MGAELQINLRRLKQNPYLDITEAVALILHQSLSEHQLLPRLAIYKCQAKMVDSFI